MNSINDTINSLSESWIELKNIEQEAQKERRLIEDELINVFKINEQSKGTFTEKTEEYVLKVACRIEKKVNTEAVIELAAEHDLKTHLESLFRWKAEVNELLWKNSDSKITDVLSRGITTKPGRPSFSITKREDK